MGRCVAFKTRWNNCLLIKEDDMHWSRMVKARQDGQEINALTTLAFGRVACFCFSLRQTDFISFFFISGTKINIQWMEMREQWSWSQILAKISRYSLKIFSTGPIKRSSTNLARLLHRRDFFIQSDLPMSIIITFTDWLPYNSKTQPIYLHELTFSSLSKAEQRSKMFHIMTDYLSVQEQSAELHLEMDRLRWDLDSSRNTVDILHRQVSSGTHLSLKT